MVSSSACCLWSFVIPLKCQRRSSVTLTCCADNQHHYIKCAPNYWDNFYRRHHNKFFKDRHYLGKDWAKYFTNHQDSHATKVVLEVGCGSGNTIYPLLDAFPNIYVHACDFSPQAISLVKAHPNFNASQMNVFLCDVATDDLSININPSSVDVITLVFTLSAFPPNKMSSVLQNLKKVLKPKGYILLRDYAIGDATQVKLQKKNQLISENFYFRADGTCAFFFSEDFLSTLFSTGGLDIMDVNTYYRQIKNRSKNITMQRYWIRTVFRADRLNISST